jgi:hypothetical protein
MILYISPYVLVNSCFFRINHGQVDASKGRITRRRTAHPNLTVSTGTEIKKSPVVTTSSLRPPALTINMCESAPRLNEIQEKKNDFNNGGQNLRQIRNAVSLSTVSFIKFILIKNFYYSLEV